jgi:hypothetical protein
MTLAGLARARGHRVQDGRHPVRGVPERSTERELLDWLLANARGSQSNRDVAPTPNASAEPRMIDNLERAAALPKPCAQPQARGDRARAARRRHGSDPAS